MDLNEHDNSDSKAEFRKPLNDGANRKYRRRSPVGDSSSSDGSPKRNRGLSPNSSRKDSAKSADDRRKHEDYRDLGRDYSRSLLSRNSGESFKNSERRSSWSHHRLNDAYDRCYSKSSHHSGRESREGHRSDYYRGGRDHPSRSYGDEMDKYYKEKYDGSGHRSRRHEDRDGDIEGRGGRHPKTECRSPYDSRRDGSGYRMKETSLGDVKEAGDAEKFVKYEKRGHDDCGKFKEPQSIHEHSADGGPFSSEDKDALAKKPKIFTNSEGTKADGHSEQGVKDSDIDAAKIAAMKAAELVNKNLVRTGYMSADQKKKLLWGNKKNTTSEEPAHRWDMTMFGDRERQEKFNKLMGVKGDTNLQNKPDHPDVEKQREELQMELEKQYTAGLRRRDGRTVGLGL